MTYEPKSQVFGESSEISVFILSFIQALLKTGYYTPGHPETSRARKGLYNSLLAAIKGHKEITFITKLAKESRDVIIDGINDEPISLSGFMLQGRAEMFVPKFLDYFDRKNLSSFSIKAGITEEGFETFIDIMSESPGPEEKAHDSKEELTMELISKGVLNVSTIFNIDIVGKDRKLPWRVEVSLTRLKKDLSLIPLYKNLSEEKKAEIKNMVFDDIIRPIKAPSIIKDILINLDIISNDIAGISKEEFEDRVTDFMHKEHVLQAAPELLKFYLMVKQSYETLKDENILPRLTFLEQITRKIGLKIIGYGFTDEPFLLDCFESGILTIDNLPENVRAKIKRRTETDIFIKDPRKFIAALEEAESREDIDVKAVILLNLVPELLKRGSLMETEEILGKAALKGFDFSKTGSALAEEIMLNMEKKLEEAAKEELIRILRMMGLMGRLSNFAFVNLITHNNRLVRKISCEILIQRGRSVIPIILNRLEGREDGYFIRNALMILGEAGHASPELKDVFEKYINHDESSVRAEAVGGISNISGKDIEALLLKALNDDDVAVRRRAVFGLGKIKSLNPETTGYFSDIITGERKEDDSIVEHALTSLQSYDPELSETQQLREVIQETLAKGESLLGKFSSGHVLSSRLKTKACETLGFIGDDKSINLLKKLAKNKDSHISKKALEAVERISERF
ncbi:MAG: HEAT repeat domain-containing protein [Nitrospirae bacterium]|nr:HEAT repeat domain-containing protein [Nitrospirota bacterium]